MQKGIFYRADPLDIEEFLFKIEQSYYIQFTENDWEKRHTLNNFVELVIFKLIQKGAVESQQCTTQRLFYRIRATLLEQHPTLTITPSTKLNKLFPLHQRKRHLQHIEQVINSKTDTLTVPLLFTFSALFLVSASIFNFLSQQWLWFIVTIPILFIFLFLKNRFTYVFKDNTLKEFIQRIARENYINVQPSYQFNRNEVEQNIKAMLIEDFRPKKPITSSTYL